MVRAVVGANWGDEGKGKITDMLGQESDIIVRFQGGANAEQLRSIRQHWNIWNRCWIRGVDRVNRQCSQSGSNYN